MGVQALIYYMLTTVIAVFTGIILVLMLQPGKRGRETQAPSSGGFNESLQASDALLDLIRSENTALLFVLKLNWMNSSKISFQVTEFRLPVMLTELRLPVIFSFRNMFPSNLVEACFKQVTRFSDCQ